MLAGADKNKNSLTLSTNTERHVPIFAEYEFDYPENLKKSEWEYTKVIGLIIDCQTGEVVNAAEGPLLVAISVDELSSPAPIRLQGNNLTASSPFRQVEIWSLGGQLLHQATPDTDSYVLPQIEMKGQPVLIKAMTDGESATFKYIYK